VGRGQIRLRIATMWLLRTAARRSRGVPCSSQAVKCDVLEARFCQLYVKLLEFAFATEGGRPSYTPAVGTLFNTNCTFLSNIWLWEGVIGRTPLGDQPSGGNGHLAPSCHLLHVFEANKFVDLSQSSHGGSLCAEFTQTMRCDALGFSPCSRLLLTMRQASWQPDLCGCA